MTPAALPPELAIDTLRTIRALVTATGAQMRDMASELRHATAKDGVDLVTRADTFCERELTQALAATFPAHRILAEEGTQLGDPACEWTWHLDPLDGTANYARGIPYWSVSLGLAFRHQPVLGIVHAPAYGVTVFGAVGLGAWRDDQPLADATPAGEPGTWLVATDWPWDRAERARTNRLLDALSPQIRQYKTCGSAALDLAHLALGQVDAYAISHIFPWDQAAGAAIARTLGYELRTRSGAPWDLTHPDIVACRPGMWPVLGAATRA